MLTILICKLFHIKQLTEECEWISISVTDCNILSNFLLCGCCFVFLVSADYESVLMLWL